MIACAQIAIFVKDMRIFGQFDNLSNHRTASPFCNSIDRRVESGNMRFKKISPCDLTIKSIFSKFGILTAGLALIMVLLSASLAQADTYYSWTNAAPEATLSWWTGNNGTGSHPGNFTTAGDIFIIQNNNTMTNAASWTVNGTVQINSGCSLVFTAAASTLNLGVLNRKSVV